MFKLIKSILLISSIYICNAYAFDMEQDISPLVHKRATQVSYGQSSGMKLDIYGLENGYQNAPVILMVHGGAWRYGDKANLSVVENKMPYFINKGYIFISMNYDLSPKADPIEQSVQVLKAIAYLQNNAAKYGINPAQINLMGHSAGAHISALATTSSDLQSRAMLKYPVSSVVLLDSAAFDVTKIMTADRVYPFYKAVFGTDQRYWRDTSPINKVHQGLPPMMLICSKFRDDSCSQAFDFANRSKLYGNNVVFYPVSLNHGEITSMVGYSEQYTKDIHGFIGQFTGK